MISYEAPRTVAVVADVVDGIDFTGDAVHGDMAAQAQPDVGPGGRRWLRVPLRFPHVSLPFALVNVPSGQHITPRLSA